MTLNGGPNERKTVFMRSPTFNVRSGVRSTLLVTTVFVITVVMTLLLSPQRGEADPSYWPSNGWNGYKVYLSPADHGGGNVGCNGYNEDRADEIALEAAIGYGYDLRARHYWVMVGDGNYVANENASETFGSDIHIPIHSNAKATNCSGSVSYGGTRVLYQYSDQIPLATQLKDRIGVVLEANDDKICKPGYPDYCSQYNSLGELTVDGAVEAYVEAEYHTYTLGVNFLLDRTWQWRLGYAVDKYLGYPREPYIY